MYLFYSLLLAFGFLILLPRFIYDAFKHGKYVAGFRERLGNVESQPSGEVIWIHCVSVGETQAARPLVLELRKQFPNNHIVISTITVTGQTLARQIFKNDARAIFYFPFDWRFSVSRTLDRVRPKLVIIMETELWPRLLRECSSRAIPVALVNGRLSERSFRRYRLIKSFMTRVLGGLNLAIMQTEADAERIQVLGMSSSRVRVAGNVKFDAGALSGDAALTQEILARFDLNQGPLILAASTHAPEERILLQTFRGLVERHPTLRMMIAPRHPERFDDVAELLNNSGWSFARRSSAIHAGDKTARIVLLDSIGELPDLYSLAIVVFVGGSIAKTGGHNILEPAAVGACIVTGAYTFNFRDIVARFVNERAIVQLPPMSEAGTVDALQNLFSELLVDEDQRMQLMQQARRLMNKNRGATARTIDLLRPLIASSPQARIDTTANPEPH